MRDVLVGFSRAMYSNWLWHRSLQIVVDAGEGLQLALGNKVFAPAQLLLTHGHSDHLLGLPGFVAARRFSKGATDKPLAILYPAGSPGVQTIRSTLERLWPHAGFPLHWIPVSAGFELSLGKHRRIDVFSARHVAAEPSVGYRVLETRQRLKPQYAAMPEAELRRLAHEGRRPDLMEPYDQILFAHTGDSMPLDPSIFARADLVVHDATFLEAPDRREEIHATSAEAIEVARTALVKCLVLQHLSVRYDRAAARARLRAQVRDAGLQAECWLLDDAEFVDLTPGNR